MKLNDIPRNRTAFDHVREFRRLELLRRIGPRIEGLLVWHFGAGGEHRDVRDIPIVSVERFVRFYATS